MSAYLSIRNLSAVIKGAPRGTPRLLRSVSLDVAAGEVRGLVARFR